MRLRFLIAVPAMLVLGACVPKPAPAPPAAPRPCIDPNSSVDQAIDCAFGSLGLHRQDEAHRVAACESGKRWNAVNGQYRGIFQLGTHYNATIAFYGGDVWNPYTNAQVARDSVKVNNGWVRWECKP